MPTSPRMPRQRRGIKPPLCKGGPVLTLGCAQRSVAEVSRPLAVTQAVEKACHSEPVLTLAWESVPLLFHASGGVLLPSAAKVPKNAVQTCGLKIPCAPSHSTYLDGVHHANAVPWKFHRDVASSLLLFPLPLLL